MAKTEKMRLFLVKKFNIVKNDYMRLSKITYLKFLKIRQITEFDMGIQKNNILGQYKKIDFFQLRVSQTVALDYWCAN
jgi:hypothetical protein